MTERTDETPRRRAASLKSSAVGAVVVHASIKATAVLIAVFAARSLSVKNYGLLLSMQAFVLVGAALWDAGVGVRLTRDLAAEQGADDSLGNALWGKAHLLPVVLTTAALTYVSLLTGRPDRHALIVAVLIQCVGTGLNGLLSNALQGRHRYLLASVPLSIGRAASVVAVVLVGVTNRGSLTAIAYALALSELFTTVMLLVLCGREFGRALATPRSWRVVWPMIQASMPFAMNGIFILLYNKFDVNIVRFAGGELVAGFYGPASRFQDVFGLIPAVLITAAVPVASAHFLDREALVNLRRRLTALGLLLTVPVAVVMALGADLLVSIALGDRYARTALAVRILAISLPFIAFSGPRLAILVAADRGKSTLVIYGAAFLAACVAQTAFTVWWGLGGAAAGALVREPVLAIGASLALRRFLATSSVGDEAAT